MKIVMPEQVLIDEFINNNYDDNCFNPDGSLNKNHNSFKSTGLISKIFEDHFKEVYSENKELIDKYRPNTYKEVKKIIDCYNHNLGCDYYECPKCHDYMFISNTYKSRFCTSCGYKYKLERVENIMQTAYNCVHRQIVFTIPKELRIYFFINFHDMTNILFDAANQTLKSIANNTKFNKNKKKKSKSKNKYSIGFFAFLHTFGRNLQWNPHLHVLIAEMKLGSNDSVKKLNYFDYDALSKRFQYILLKLMSDYYQDKNFTKLKNKLYQKYKKGFYIYAEPKKFKSLKNGIEYVTRYCGRCPISENRIENYDGENVTFSYNAHEDESLHKVTVSAKEFILMLLRHLLPEQMKIIRYFGFYKRKHKLHNEIKLHIDKEKRSQRKQLLKHFMSILKSFKRDIYNCPKCNTEMKYMATIT